MNNKSLVITSISTELNQTFYNLILKSVKNNITPIIITDEVNQNFSAIGTNTINIKGQLEMPLEILEYLPLNSYSRKNIGYLVAFASQSKWIIETDDDNIPFDNFFTLDSEDIIKVRVPETNQTWINYYKLFGNNTAWPRGFPLSLIKSNQKVDFIYENIKLESIGIMQVCANKDPDVDAIFRLTQNLPQTFIDMDPVLIKSGQIAPFNSQCTWWAAKFIELMYFPSYISWRAADIWRSIIATQILHAHGYNILFWGPKVEQIRNNHNLMKDFEQEVDCYLKTEPLFKILTDTPELIQGKSLGEDLLRCYEKLFEEGFFPSEEIILLKKWLSDIYNIRSKNLIEFKL